MSPADRADARRQLATGLSSGRATRPYSVVRCSSGRPRGSTMARKASSSMRWPWAAPAAREMFSSISVPPRSLAPACRTWRAPSAPIFTHDTWMLATRPRVGDAADGVHEQRLAERRAPAGLALQVDAARPCARTAGARTR